MPYPVRCSLPRSALDFRVLGDRLPSGHVNDQIADVHGISSISSN
jgi:hypothetical protein